MKRDSELLGLYVDKQSDDAFRELVQRHLDLVYAAALRRLGGDHHAASDIAQKVFTNLARRAPALTHHTALTGWLYATTRNIAVDHVRAEQRRARREQEARAMQEAHTPDQPSINPDTLRPILDEAVDQLSTTDRQAVLSRFFAGQPFDEIAASLHVSEDAARMRVARALERLRRILAHKGLTSTAAAIGTAITATASTTTAPAGLTGSVAATALSAAANSSTAGTITLMLATHKQVIAAGLLVIVLGGTSLHQTQQARAAIEDQNALSLEVTALKVDARQTATERRRLAAELSARRAQGAPSSKSSTAAAAVAETAGSSDARTAAAKSIRSTIRELDQEIEREKVRLHFTSEWRRIALSAVPFLDRLSLSPEQMSQYMAMAEEELTPERFTGWFAGSETVETYPALLRKEWDQRTRELLGEPASEQLKRFVRAQSSISELANYVALFDQPLSTGQESSLLHLLSGEPSSTVRDDAYWNSVYDRAKTILNSEQLNAWRRSRDLTQYQNELFQAAGEASTPTPPTAEATSRS